MSEFYFLCLEPLPKDCLDRVPGFEVEDVASPFLLLSLIKEGSRNVRVLSGHKCLVLQSRQQLMQRLLHQLLALVYSLNNDSNSPFRNQFCILFSAKSEIKTASKLFINCFSPDDLFRKTYRNEKATRRACNGSKQD